MTDLLSHIDIYQNGKNIILGKNVYFYKKD